MFAVAAVVSNVVARQTERALPLSALCRLNLAFPEEAPNGVKLALRVGNSGRAEKVLEEFAREGLAADPHAAAPQTIELISALNLHDRKTGGHAEKVRALSDVIAEELALPEDERNLLRWASLLHDVGKISVPAAILNKVGKPTDDEWALLRTHPTEGEWRMAPCGRGSASGRVASRSTTSALMARAIRTASAATKWHCLRASWPSPTAST